MDKKVENSRFLGINTNNIDTNDMNNRERERKPSSNGNNDSNDHLHLINNENNHNNGWNDQDFDQDFDFDFEQEMKELVPELSSSQNHHHHSKRLRNSRVFIAIFLFIFIFGVFYLFSSIATDSSKPLLPPATPHSSSNSSTTEPVMVPISKGHNDEPIENIPKIEKHVKPEINIDPQGSAPITYEFMGLLSGSASISKSYQWVSDDKNGFPDGSYIELDGDEFVIAHLFNTSAKKKIASKYDIKTEDGSQVHVGDWSISADLKHLLIPQHISSGWRHSFFADYVIFDISRKETRPLNQSVSDKFIPHEKGSGKISLTVFAPIGNTIAWVRDNDIFITVSEDDSEDSKASAAKVKEFRITTDGSKNFINGLSDWVYEEEVLAGQTASWFSTDGKSLAFLKFDDSNVLDYELQYYAKYGEKSYPTMIDVKYPKPGTPNPLVTLHIASISSSEPVTHQVALDGFSPEDKLITEVQWINNSSLLVRAMNRVQDHQKLYYIQWDDAAKEWKVKLARDEGSVDDAWFPYLQAITLLENEAGYLELTDINPSQMTHIAYYDSFEALKPAKYLTTGDYEVVKILGIRDSVIYFQSTAIGGSAQRQVASIKLDGTDLTWISEGKDPKERIISQTDDSLGLKGSFYDALFTPRCEYYLLAYLGPDIPFEKVYQTLPSKESIPLNLPSFRFENAKSYYSSYGIPKIKYFTIKNDKGDDMNAKMILPPDFDSSGQTKYPLLMQVYGGPGSQMAGMSYDIDFMNQLPLKGYISLLVDGRGTGYKGRQFRAAVSKDLGEFEVQDQIAAAKWAGQQIYVDSKKIGIWGWSFGGYLAAKTIEADSGVFAIGISVAPVTDWKFYDTVYSERFMKTPQMNQAGYEKSAVNRMEGFKNANFLLIHGTADDNVHFQNSAELVWHLTGAHVNSYQVQFYTDSDHSMSANGARGAVYEKIIHFMCEKYGDLYC